jgi:hypothetical protein
VELMFSLREIKERGYIPQKNLRRLLIIGSLILLKMLITNLSVIKKLSKIPSSGKQYVRPSRRYELPKYEKGMKFCDSNEKYLRPTFYCNSHAPEVIALANELGAFKKTDREFAEAAFNFAKRKITLEMMPLDGVEKTLRRGCGTCLHEITVFVALCRAAGIKARYKLYSLTMIQAWEDTMIVDPLVKKFQDAMGYFMIHGEGEVFLDGKWVVCDVGPTPERQAATNTPISKFGEDSIGMWLNAVPGTIMYTESLPYGLNIMMKVVERLAPMTIDKVNKNILDEINLGKKILAEKGEEEYDKEIRKSFKPKFPEPVIKKRKSIIFEK